MAIKPTDPITDPERLAALQHTHLLDTPPEEGFDQLTRLATQVLQAPIALVSLVDSNRQFFKSRSGELPAPWTPQTETPLSYSFCKYAVAEKQPLIINDAKSHELVKDNPATRELGVAAYAGIPLILDNGQPVGTLCVMDSKPREWSSEQIQVLQSLSSAVMAMVSYRSSAHSTAAPAETNPEPLTLDAADWFAHSVSKFITSLSDYDQLVRAGATAPDALQREAESKSKVDDARARLTAAAESFKLFLGNPETLKENPELKPAIDLYDAYTAFVEAERRRNELVERFRRMEASLDEVQHQILLTSDAEQTLRLAEREFEFSRG